jgi:hypothetical protein
MARPPPPAAFLRGVAPAAASSSRLQQRQGRSMEVDGLSRALWAGGHTCMAASRVGSFPASAADKHSGTHYTANPLEMQVGHGDNAGNAVAAAAAGAAAVSAGATRGILPLS